MGLWACIIARTTQIEEEQLSDSLTAQEFAQPESSLSTLPDSRLRTNLYAL